MAGTRKARVPMAEQIRLINECRQSGMTDGLNIYGYLKFLLEHRPGKDMTDEQLAELAPWSEKLQSIKNCM